MPAWSLVEQGLFSDGPCERKTGHTAWTASRFRTIWTRRQKPESSFSQLSHGMAILIQPCGQSAFDNFLLAEKFGGGKLAFQRCSLQGSGDFWSQANGNRNQADGLELVR